MSMSLFSPRRVVAAAIGASALSGALLFGALPLAQAASGPAPTPAVASAGAGHVDTVSIWHHDPHHRHDLHHSVNIL